MGLIKLSASGDLSSTTKFLKSLKNSQIERILIKHGDDGVRILSQKTPVRTGKTANSWSYEISNTSEGPTISWNNSNVQNGITIVSLLENGHAARDGSWVPAQPFVKETVDFLEKQILNDIWKEG